MRSYFGLGEVFLLPVAEEGDKGIGTAVVEHVECLEAVVIEPHGAFVAGGNVPIADQDAGAAAEDHAVADHQGRGAAAQVKEPVFLHRGVALIGADQDPVVFQVEHPAVQGGVRAGAGGGLGGDGGLQLVHVLVQRHDGDGVVHPGLVELVLVGLLHNFIPPTGEG